ALHRPASTSHCDSARVSNTDARRSTPRPLGSSTVVAIRFGASGTAKKAPFGHTSTQRLHDSQSRNSSAGRAPDSEGAAGSVSAAWVPAVSLDIGALEPRA